MAPSDPFLLQTILQYCDDIDAAVQRFSITAEVITRDTDMKALMAFFIQQIGETANKLSPEFKATHPEIEWGAIVGFRHHIVHAYGKIIPAILWDTVISDIPELKSFCTKILSQTSTL